MKPFLLFISLLIFATPRLVSQTNLEVISGEKLYGDEIKKLTYIVKNVGFKHNGVTIYCDSAIRKLKEGIVEGFGHIYIFQQDTFTLSGGEYLRYEEATKVATVTGKQVILNDKEMTLVTTALQYNTAQQIGSYHNNANILSGENTLKSKHGYYQRRTNIFNFKENVVLTSPQYTMYCDTLDYFAGTKTAYFQGPTKIISKENTITCNYGWYNTATEQAQFSREATIISDSTTITADSLLYNRKKGIGNAFGNIRLYDSANHIEVYGQKGLYTEKTKETVITQLPLAIQISDNDTMYVQADTFYYVNDSVKRQLQAWPRTALAQKEFQGRCDSLVYRFNDSTISLYHQPILWNALNQITGDTMHIVLKNKRIHTLTVLDNAFLASEVKPFYYNQISGRTMLIQFDSNKLKSVLVDGNAESIYYLSDNETDSAEYTGVNKVAGGKMLIQMKNSKVNGIRFFSKPEGKMYPLKDFPDGEKYLAGLIWQVDKKPTTESFLERKKKRIVLPVEVKEKPVKPKKKAKTKKK
ncbi:MAG: OstA-like protein [Bacteroidota bacterium]